MNDYNPSLFFSIYGHGDFEIGRSLQQIETYKIDIFDEDLEDDDTELYQRLDIDD
jgi:hypothetical protein